MSQVHVIPYLQFRSKSIVEYNHYEFSEIRPRSFRQERSAKLFTEKKTYSGMLCPGAKKRLTKAIEILVERSAFKTRTNPKTGRQYKFKLNFITLTVYSTERNITGKEAHQTCLEPFLLWLKRKHGVTMYIWKAELQKRGQIHYHLTSDTYVPWKSIRNKWNELQREAGYLNSFYAKYGCWDANSTDVHAVWKEKNLAMYLKKEIVKAYQNEKSLGGKVWDCSLNIKAASYYETEGYGEVRRNLMTAVQRKEVRETITDHCRIYDFMYYEPAKILAVEQTKEYREHTQDVYKYERNPKRNEVFPEPQYQPPRKIFFKPQLNLFSTS